MPLFLPRSRAFMRGDGNCGRDNEKAFLTDLLFAEIPTQGEIDDANAMLLAAAADQ